VQPVRYVYVGYGGGGGDGGCRPVEPLLDARAVEPPVAQGIPVPPPSQASYPAVQVQRVG